MSRIFRAARRGDLGEVKALLDRKPGLVRKKGGFDDWTPLHVAAQGGCLEIAKILLDKGATVNAGSLLRDTPLRLAVAKGHVSVVRLLLANKADVSAKDLEVAIRLCPKACQREVIEALFGAGVEMSFDAASELGDAALSVAKSACIPALEDLVLARRARQSEAKKKRDAAMAAFRRTLANSGATIEEMHREFIARTTAPEDFGVALSCPNCGGPINNYSCAQCGAPRGKAGVASKRTAMNVVVTSLQLLGWAVLGPLSRAHNKDLTMEMIRTNSTHRKEVILAALYREEPAAYDQAAVCYVTWLKAVGRFDCPAGLIDFVKRYGLRNEVNPALKRALLEVAFVKGCQAWSEIVQAYGLITSAYVGSEAQMTYSQIIEDWEKYQRMQGQNTSSLKSLVTLLHTLEQRIA